MLGSHCWKDHGFLLSLGWECLMCLIHVSRSGNPCPFWKTGNLPAPSHLLDLVPHFPLATWASRPFSLQHLHGCDSVSVLVVSRMVMQQRKLYTDLCCFSWEKRAGEIGKTMLPPDAISFQSSCLQVHEWSIMWPQKVCDAGIGAKACFMLPDWSFPINSNMEIC